MTGSHRFSAIIRNSHLLIGCLNRIPCLPFSDGIKVILLGDILECLYLPLGRPLCRGVLLPYIPGGICPAHHELACVIQLLVLLCIRLLTLSEASTLECKGLTLGHPHVQFRGVKGGARVKVRGDLIVFVASRVLRGRLWPMRGAWVQVRCRLLLRHEVFLLRDEVGG